MDAEELALRRALEENRLKETLKKGQPSQPKATWGEALKTGFSPGKVFGFGEQMFTGLGNILKFTPGGPTYQGISPEEIENPNPLNLAKEIYGLGSSFLSHLGKRWADPKNTLMNDPAGAYGMLGDVSMATGGAGSLARTTGMQGLAKGLQAASGVTNPVGIPGNIVKGVRKGVAATGLPERIWESQLKIPPSELSQVRREGVIGTLSEGKAGRLGGGTVNRMTQIIEGLDKDIEGIIQSATRPGVNDVSFSVISKALDDLKLTYRNHPHANQIVDAIDGIKQTFREHEFVAQTKMSPLKPITQAQVPPGGSLNIQRQVTPWQQTTPQTIDWNIPLSDAHQLKKGAYQEIVNWYKKSEKAETGKIGIRNDYESVATDAGARAIKDAILNSPDIPDIVKSKLSQEAEMLKARRWVERATNRGGNIDIPKLQAIMFGLLTESGIPGAVGLHAVLSQPVMTQFAIWLKKGSQTIQKLGDVATPMGLATYQASRANQLANQRQK